MHATIKFHSVQYTLHTRITKTTLQFRQKWYHTETENDTIPHCKTDRHKLLTETNIGNMSPEKLNGLQRQTVDRYAFVGKHFSDPDLCPMTFKPNQFVTRVWKVFVWVFLQWFMSHRVSKISRTVAARAWPLIPRTFCHWCHTDLVESNGDECR